MASFNKKQINDANILEVGNWAKSGGWDYGFTPLKWYKSTFDLLMSEGIYVVYLMIDGKEHRFYSKGAKNYGIENLD